MKVLAIASDKGDLQIILRITLQLSKNIRTDTFYSPEPQFSRGFTQCLIG